MKKIILTILCVALALVVLTACGRENVGDYTQNPTQKTTVTTTTSTTTRKTTENRTTGVLTPTTNGEMMNSTTTKANG